MPPFERTEYEGRVAQAKRRMEAAGIEVLLVTSPANIYYLTGYDACSFYTHQMVILAGEADEPIWAGRALDASGARLTVYMAEDNIRGYGDHFVGTRKRHPMQFMAEILREAGWDGRAVGVEMDEYYFTARCYEVLRRELPEADFRDAGLLVNWIRLVKSPQELTYMREAGEIAARTIQATLDRIEPGVRQSTPVSALYAAQIAGTDAFGGDYSCKPPITGTGARSETVHLTWEDKLHQEGETTWIETGGFVADIGFLADPLSASFMCIITGVGFLIHVYSIGYMSDESDRHSVWRFFSYLNLFVFAMLLLVMGDNLLLMFVGWEGVGLCSYLLIGFWFENAEFASAGKKAFVTNRVGDFCFILGMFWLFWSLGEHATLNFAQLEEVIVAHPELVGGV